MACHSAQLKPLLELTTYLVLRFEHLALRDHLKPHRKRPTPVLNKLVSAEISTLPPRLRSAVSPAMLDLDDINKAVNYPPRPLTPSRPISSTASPLSGIRSSMGTTTSTVCFQKIRDSGSWIHRCRTSLAGSACGLGAERAFQSITAIRAAGHDATDDAKRTQQSTPGVVDSNKQ